ncbi:PTS sugar transporter subunit IIA [Tepidanaerobacter syntrophicus]|uniref:PTS sugar transporter subunit IIA n=1 Tax=Tepidanaerobacter syntrophicus TaxID=224999 RepID=UPI001BD6762F|nr:PTS sugar transporter subunit IIA [Tepidanaerobacter syntrophicus]
MEILNLFNTNLIVTNLEARSKEDIFEKLYDKLYKNGFVKKDYLRALIEREQNFPTGLKLESYGVAIPHTDPEYVEKAAISVATLKKPVIFKNMADPTEDVPINIVFMIALNEAHSQVRVLEQLIQLIQNEEKMKEIIKSNNAEEIINLIKKAICFESK